MDILSLRNHFFHPLTDDTIHLTCKQKTTAIVLGALLLPFLFIPGIVAFYGISYYFKQKQINQLKQCSVVGTVGTTVLKTKTPVDSHKKSPTHKSPTPTPINTPKSPTPLTTPSLVKDPVSQAYCEVQDAISQLKNLTPKDKIAQYDLIEQAIKSKNLDWPEFIACLDQNHSEAFSILFNVALLKCDKASVAPYLKHMDLVKLGNAIEEKLTLKIGNQALTLNKDLLSTFIPYFATSFHFQSVSTELQCDEVDIDTLKDILNKLLFNQPANINGGNLIAWIHGCSVLDLGELKPEIEEFLEANHNQIDFRELIKTFEMYAFTPQAAIEAKVLLHLQKSYENLTLAEHDELIALIPFVAKNLKIPLIQWLGDNLDDLNLDVFTEIFEKYDLTPKKDLKDKFSALKAPISSFSAKEKERFFKLLPFGKEYIKCIWLTDNLSDIGWDNFVALYTANNIFSKVLERRVDKILTKATTATEDDKKELDLLLPFLKSFSVTNKDVIRPELYEYFLKMVNLKHLNIFDLADPSLLSYLNSCPKLKCLHIHKSITDSDLAKLKHLPNLQKLILDIQNITDQGLAHLTSFTELKDIQLKNGYWVKAKTTLTGEGLSHLTSLSKLKKFRIESPHLTDQAIHHISNFPSLEYLTIFGDNTSQISGAGLTHLTGLSSLKGLALEAMDTLSDDDLACLQSMPKLRKLALSYCPNISDKVFDHIEKSRIVILEVHQQYIYLESKKIPQMQALKV